MGRRAPRLAIIPVLTTEQGKGYLKIYASLAVVALCSTMNGFDGSLMGSINALQSYTDYYGLPKTGSTSTGIVFAIFNVSVVFSRTLLQPELMLHFFRRLDK